jgi:hypothetical protein
MNALRMRGNNASIWGPRACEPIATQLPVTYPPDLLASQPLSLLAA